MSSISTHAALLQRYNHRPIITPAEALIAIGRTPEHPDQAAELAIAKHRFPVRTIKIGGRRMVHLRDLAEFIDAARDDAIAVEQHTATEHEVAPTQQAANADEYSPAKKSGRTKASAKTKRAAMAAQEVSP